MLVGGESGGKYSEGNEEGAEQRCHYDQGLSSAKVKGFFCFCFLAIRLLYSLVYININQVLKNKDHLKLIQLFKGANKTV